MYFGVFWANFYDFFTIVLFYWLKWALKRPLLLEQLLDKWLEFCGYEALLCCEIGQKVVKIETFLIF